MSRKSCNKMAVAITTLLLVFLSFGYPATKAYATPVDLFPVPVSNSTTLFPYVDDSYLQVNFTQGFTFNFYGVTYSSIFLNTNGGFTFGAGDDNYDVAAYGVTVPGVAVGGVTNLLGLEFTLNYDSSLMSLQSIPGPDGNCGTGISLSGLSTSSWIILCSVPSTGQLSVGMLGVNEAGAPLDQSDVLPISTTTTATIVRINFSADAEALTTLSLTEVILGDYSAAEIPRTTSGASVNISTPTDPFPEPKPTTQWVDFYGPITFNGSDLAKVGDVVAAFDPAGVLCGKFSVTTEGQYGFLHCYRDDTTTTTVDEGASPGETITFKVWEASMGWVLDAQIVSGSNTWTVHGDSWELNLNAERPFNLPIPTTQWVDFYGNVSIDVGVAADVGDIVVAYDPQGAVCGTFVVSNAGQYGFLHCYRDDGTTTSIDEGAQPGDDITFKIWDASENELLDTQESGDASIWTAHGDSYNVHLTVVREQQIPLYTGWNLISFSVNKVYYDTANAPTVTMLNDPNLSYEKLATIKDALSSIDGLYRVVLSFDSSGGHTYNPLLPTFSDLHYLAPGYGYWIKMKDLSSYGGVVYLVLQGGRVSEAATRDLQVGWNLTGFWQNHVLYSTAQPPSSCLFPPDTTDFVNISSMSSAFSSLGGTTAYKVVLGFDCTGGKTWNPALPTFSDLRYVGPGYGYWIKMNQTGTLSWP